jgi:hypothetical protein
VEKRPSFQTLLQTLKSIKDEYVSIDQDQDQDQEEEEEDYDDEYDDYDDDQYEQNETVFSEQNVDVRSKEYSNSIEENNYQQFKPNIPAFF